MATAQNVNDPEQPAHVHPARHPTEGLRSFKVVSEAELLSIDAAVEDEIGMDGPIRKGRR